MAKIYGNYNADFGSNPPGNASPQQEGKKRTLSNVFDFSKQAAIGTGDTPVVGKAMKGWAFRGGQIFTDTSLATSTIAIGIAGATTKYKAAATFTAVNTLTPLAGVVGAGAFDPLTADEEIIITVAVLALPAAGKLYVDLDFLVA